MSLTSEAFISSFYSLNGITIGERRKNLFLLLKQTDPSLQIDLSLLHPRTFLEESFKLEVLLYFRKLQDLVEILKSENPALIKKVLKVKWFVQEIFKNPNDLLSVFPYVSFNVKVKLLNKLAMHLRDVQQADCLFRLVYNNYGLHLALKLIPACTDSLVLEYFSNCHKQIFPKHILIVIKRRLELTEKVLDALIVKNVGAVRAYQTVFAHLLCSGCLPLMQLYQKYNLRLRMGRRLTHKFITTYKDQVITDANYFYKLLHKTQTIKSLKNEFQYYYLNLFPPRVENIPRALPNLLDIIAKLLNHRKIAIIEETFKKMYDTEIWLNQNCVSIQLLALAPVEKRISVPVKPKCLSDDNWCCYLGTDQSIPLLQKKISLSSDVSTRLILTKYLVETCKINCDKKALGEVCKYFLKQHRNDHISIRSTFLTTIKNMFTLETLDEEHWICINELLDIFEMNHENFSSANVFLFCYIHYLLLSGSSIEEHLAEYLKREDRWLGFKGIKFEKHCLLLIATILPQIFHGDKLQHKTIIFLTNLIDYNMRHKDNLISIFNYPDTVSVLITMLEQKSDLHWVNIQYIVNYCLTVESTPHLTNLCISVLTECNWSLLYKLLHNNILAVSENIEIIAKLAIENQILAFWRYCRNYSHLELPQKIVRSCSEIINQDRDVYNKQKAIICLSYLMPVNDFLLEVSKYYPTNKKASGMTSEDKALYNNQKAFTGCLKNVVPRSLALPSALQFCLGDYLKIILSSLYSLASNVNENHLHAFFNELATRAVSVRKHVIHLTIRVLDRSAILNMFNTFIANEKNSSVRKFLLKGSFNLFLQETDAFMWSLVKLNVNAVSLEDKEIIEMLIQIEKIPSKYIVEYVLFIWNFLNNSEVKPDFKEQKKCELLRLLSETVIQNLPKDFSISLIQEYFHRFLKGQENKSLIFSVYNFTCKFIIYCVDQTEQEERINMVVSFLKQFSLDDHTKYLVNDFLKAFCTEFLHKKCKEKCVLERFCSIWSVHMESAFAVDQCIHLQLTLLFVDTVHGLSLKEVGQEIAELAFGLRDKYGDCILLLMSDRLKYFCDNFTRDGCADIKLYDLIEGIIEGSKLSSIMILGIALLKSHINDGAIKPRHNKVVEKLKNMNDPVINMYLNRYLYGINM